MKRVKLGSYNVVYDAYNNFNRQINTNMKIKYKYN